MQMYGSTASPDFQYPETMEYKAATVVVKSRKLPNGRFEAVAAFFFNGVRMNQFRAFGASRSAALKVASRLSNTGGR